MATQNNAQIAPSALSIENISIRQDKEGRYCLNDLHKASGGNQNHRPSNFLRTAQTKALIEEICQSSNMSFGPVNTLRGGNHRNSTYACKELVYAYAMWISPSFHLKVIRAYDAMTTETLKQPKHLSLPAATNKDYNTARAILANLRKTASSGMQDDIANLERCLVSAWTEMDEALFRFEQGISFLKRWRNK